MNTQTQYDYGKCQHCGAKNVRSPKTGKIFCENKCWLNQQAKTFQSVNKEPNWDKIRNEKSEDIALNNAKKCATDFLVAAINKGELTLKDAIEKMPALVEYVYKIGMEDKKQ